MNKYTTHHISVEQNRRYRNSVGHGRLAYSMWHRAFLARFCRGCEGWWQGLLQNQPTKSQKVWHILRATVHWRHLLRIVEEKINSITLILPLHCCDLHAQLSKMSKGCWYQHDAKHLCSLCRYFENVLTALVGSGHWLPLYKTHSELDQLSKSPRHRGLGAALCRWIWRKPGLKHQDQCAHNLIKGWSIQSGMNSKR